jgi:cell division protein ZipA
MDANTLRLILIVVGVMLILALYLWERRRAGGDDVDDDSDDDVHWEDRHEPNLDPWEGSSFDAAPRSSLGGAGFAEGRKAEYTTGRHSLAASRPTPPPPEPEPDLDQPLIVQLSVVAASGEQFDGAGIVRAASSCGLEPGEMDVFHCYLGDEQAQRTLFRVANLVKPGTFPFGGMEGFATPGLVLFASLEGEADDLAAADELVATARCLAEELGGEIRDETRTPFTAKKEEGLRARVLARMQARDAEVEADAGAEVDEP